MLAVFLAQTRSHLDDLVAFGSRQQNLDANQIGSATSFPISADTIRTVIEHSKCNNRRIPDTRQSLRVPQSSL